MNNPDLDPDIIAAKMRARPHVPLTLGEAGYVLDGISRERVRQLENIALMKFCRGLADHMKRDFPHLLAAMEIEEDWEPEDVLLWDGDEDDGWRP